ncbi:MAG: PLP-dependent aminotransferase family protein [Eubacterium sp.]|nr:PLP-dependent aminotransferase family protein [Eubacterium sp.]
MSRNSGDEPVYMKLYKKLRDDIVSGVYAYGSRLPSKRVLADESGASVITVEHAYFLLMDEGYIEARERSGYFVSFRKDNWFTAVGKIDEPNTSAEKTEKVSDPLMTAGSTDGSTDSPTDDSANDPTDDSKVKETRFPFSVLSRTMRRVISEYGEEIMQKSPNAGRKELREALKKYLARSRGIYVDIDQIVIGSGSEYLYGMITELLGRDKIYAIERPSYKKIEEVYRALELSYEQLELKRDGIDSRALSETGADVLHTTPFRSFPSGVTASASKRHEYIRWADRPDRFIIEDDFESEFSVSRKPVETLFNMSTNDNVIYMNTFSRTISPALRVGYMVIPKKLVDAFEKRVGFYSCTVPTFEQLVLSELLDSGDFERNINRIRRSMRAAKGVNIVNHK